MRSDRRRSATLRPSQLDPRRIANRLRAKLRNCFQGRPVAPYRVGWCTTISGKRKNPRLGMRPANPAAAPIRNDVIASQVSHAQEAGLRRWRGERVNSTFERSLTVQKSSRCENLKKSSLLQNSVRARNFPWFWIAGAGGSGWRWPEAGDAEDLIGGERDDAEHEVAFDLDRAAHAQEPGAEFVLQSSIDAFDHGAEIVDDVICVGHVDELHPVDLPFPFGLDLMLGAKVAVDDRRVAERTAVVMNGGGVVGGVHEIVEIGNPRAGHGHQGNGDLTVVNGGRSQHAGDGDLAASDVDMQLVADPGFLVALAVFLGADIASGGQFGKHLVDVL